MPYKNLFSLILKILGIIFLWSFLSTIPNILFLATTGAWSAERGKAVSITVLLIAWINICLAWLFFFKTEWVLQLLKLDKIQQSGDENSSISNTSLMLVGIVVFSATILISAIPEFIQLVIYNIEVKGYSSSLSHQLSSIIICFCKILVGIFLILFRRQLAGWLAQKPPIAQHS